MYDMANEKNRILREMAQVEHMLNTGQGSKVALKAYYAKLYRQYIESDK